MTPPDRPTAQGRVLIGVAIFMLALNLRPAVNVVGAVLPELRRATGLSATAAGVLTAIPTLSFALVGVLGPALAGAVGAYRSVVYALAAMVVGQLLRALVPGGWALLGGSAVTLAGVAVSNVLLPAIVRTQFPGRVASVTAIYATLLSTGGAVASAVTLPIQHAFGGTWRLGLGMWVTTSAVVLVPWLTVVLADRRHPTPKPVDRGTSWRVRDLLRSRLAWSMAGYFGLQSMQAYVVFGWLPELLVGSGVTDTRASLQVAIIAVVGVLISPTIPGLLTRVPPRGLITGLAAGYLVGYLGLWWAPTTATWLWSVCIGLGTGAFPLALTLLAVRSRTAGGTLALSAFAQSFGYLMASVGPFGFGLLHDLSGGYSVPLLALAGTLLVKVLLGMRVTRPAYLEDDLPARN